MRAVGGDQAGRTARQRRDHKRREVEVPGGCAGAEGNRVGRVAGVATHAILVPLAVGELALGALGHRGHHRHRLDRIRAHRGLAGEHDRVGPVEDGIGHVGDLGASRARRGDHRLEHLRGGDRGPGESPGKAEHPLLDQGDVLDRELDAKVAARDHHAVGRVDDLLGGVDGLGLLDLGDQGQPGVAADAGHVLGRAHERQRYEIDADRLAEAEHVEVLLGYGDEAAR